MSSQEDIAATGKGFSRRTVVKSAAWSVPIIATIVATPLAAASTPPPAYAIESNFGVGWYPTVPGNQSAGALQYDVAGADKYLRVTGTTVGDQITGIRINVLISVGWPAPTFTSLAGSNPDWSTLTSTGATQVINGVTYNVYESTYSNTVIATGTTTDIPMGFYFRSASPYYPGQTAQTSRFATVNITAISLVRTPANIADTNVALSDAPTP